MRQHCKLIICLTTKNTIKKERRREKSKELIVVICNYLYYKFGI